MKVLNPNGPVPLYFQLQEDLKKDIENGIYKVNDKIPTEKELEELYSVSRITVRKAIEGLVFEGLLQKKQGVGTIVCNKRMVESVSSLLSFTEKMRGHKVDTKVLDVNLMVAPERISKHLQIKPGEEVLFVKRLRYVDDEPIALFSTYLRSDLGLTEKDDFRGSLFNLLENKYNVAISYSERTIFASEASEEIADLLNIKMRTPILMVSYHTFNTDERPIEYAEGIYRSDKFEYKLKLVR
jgi:GntR family transcriptional regulator